MSYPESIRDWLLLGALPTGHHPRRKLGQLCDSHFADRLMEAQRS